MQAKINKTGKVVNGRIADIFVNKGIATEIEEKEAKPKAKTEQVEVEENEPVKKKAGRKPKAKTEQE